MARLSLVRRVGRTYCYHVNCWSATRRRATVSLGKKRWFDQHRWCFWRFDRMCKSPTCLALIVTNTRPGLHLPHCRLRNQTSRKERFPRFLRARISSCYRSSRTFPRHKRLSHIRFRSAEPFAYRMGRSPIRFWSCRSWAYASAFCWLQLPY